MTPRAACLYALYGAILGISVLIWLEIYVPRPGGPPTRSKATGCPYHPGHDHGFHAHGWPVPEISIQGAEFNQIVFDNAR